MKTPFLYRFVDLLGGEYPPSHPNTITYRKGKPILEDGQVWAHLASGTFWAVYGIDPDLRSDPKWTEVTQCGTGGPARLRVPTPFFRRRFMLVNELNKALSAGRLPLPSPL